MPSLTDIPTGKTPAQAQDIQQIIDTLTARRNTPVAVTVNDPVQYTITLKNTDPNGRGIILYAPDGSTVLLSVDATGVKVSHAGGPAAPPLTDVGPGGDEVAIGNHVHGSGGYAGTGTVSLETLYSGTTIVTAINYAVDAAVLFVFCSAGITITLPAAATTNRPITVIGLAGSSTVIAVSGGVIGGSTNITTGVVMDGIVSAGDSVTYKSDGVNYRVI